MLTPVQRTIQLLELLLQSPQGLRPQEILAHLDTSRSTLFAMLRTLKALGYVSQGQERGRYQAGPRLLAWRTGAEHSPRDLLQAFYRENEHHPFTETLGVFVSLGERAVLLAQVESPRRVRSVFPERGDYRSESSAAAALLLSPDETTRRRGYTSLTIEDGWEIAMPICADGVHPTAALACTAPQQRLEAHLEENIHHLRTLAARISYRLGATYYAPFEQAAQPALGPTVTLDEAARNAFLQEPWAAKLACLTPEGAAHIVPVWHLWDGTAFYLPAWEGSRWADYLRLNANLSLSIDEPWPPLRRVVARGQAAALPAAQAEAILRRIIRRYLGEEHLPRRIEAVFRLQPDYLKGWHN